MNTLLYSSVSFLFLSYLRIGFDFQHLFMLWQDLFQYIPAYGLHLP